MNTKVIPDLSAALTLAGKAGLKEHQMIHEARALLTKPLGIFRFCPKENDWESDRTWMEMGLFP